MAQDVHVWMVWKYCGVSPINGWFWGFRPYVGLFSSRKPFCDLFINCPLWLLLSSVIHQPVNACWCYLYPAENTLSIDATISTGATVGITAVIIGTIALITGFLAGVLVYHCISKQSSKPETSSHQQQKAAVPQQQAGPEYEEVVIDVWSQIQKQTLGNSKVYYCFRCFLHSSRPFQCMSTCILV